MMKQSENFDRAAPIGQSQSCLNFRSEFWVSASERYSFAPFRHCFYGWCLNELNSRAMLKHCIFSTFARDFELAAVTAFSKKLEKKKHFLYRPTVSPQFHKNIENRGSPHNLFGGPCRGLLYARAVNSRTLWTDCCQSCCLLDPILKYNAK